MVFAGGMSSEGFSDTIDIWDTQTSSLTAILGGCDALEACRVDETRKYTGRLAKDALGRRIKALAMNSHGGTTQVGTKGRRERCGERIRYSRVAEARNTAARHHKS